MSHSPNDPSSGRAMLRAMANVHAYLVSVAQTLRAEPAVGEVNTAIVPAEDDGDLHIESSISAELITGDAIELWIDAVAARDAGRWTVSGAILRSTSRGQDAVFQLPTRHATDAEVLDQIGQLASSLVSPMRDAIATGGHRNGIDEAVE